MDDVQDHSVTTARQAAERDELDDWVADFLASPGSDNPELGEQLTSRRRWWAGPVRLPLDQLNRLAGPPGAPVMREVDEDDWRDDVDELAAEIADGFEPPPVIVTHQGGQLVLEDGNHRVEALRRAGRTAAWGVVAFDDPDERDAFTPPTA
jgi:hypothetical protein